jgi:CheY-like chemotaxis protein
LCRLHLEAEVPDVRRARPDVPEALALLLRSMLDKNPRARPPSADSLALRFRQIRDRGVEPKRAPALPKNRLSVLVVDDDPDLLKVLPFYVRKAMPDAEVRTASDGERALEAIRAHAPDVMLLDLQMPKMNGIELCMYLRGTHFADACTIVSVSAGAQPHDQALLQQLGIRHFLTKGRDLGSHIAKVLHEVRPAREPGAPVR